MRIQFVRIAKPTRNATTKTGAASFMTRDMSMDGGGAPPLLRLSSPGLVLGLEPVRALIQPAATPAAASADFIQTGSVSTHLGRIRTRAQAPVQDTTSSNTHAPARDSHSRSSSFKTRLVTPTKRHAASDIATSKRGAATV